MVHSTLTKEHSQTESPWIEIDHRPAALENESFVLQKNCHIKYQSGTIAADRFFVGPSDAISVISGNGNIDYGNGEYDLLDLSNLTSHEVVKWIDATTNGVAFNPGGGTRLFDAIQLRDGRQILFEGLDSVVFSDRIYELSIRPNDTDFYKQRNLHMIGAHGAWRFTKGSHKVLIGIQDSGIAYDPRREQAHSDITYPISLPSNIQDDFSRTSNHLFCASQFTSHGTSVQSIISAESNNGYGISGINWVSEVAHVDVMGDDGTDFTFAQATRFMLDTARQKGQRLVVNMSLCSPVIQPLFAEIIRENQENALFVIAAGNRNESTVSYPASLSQRYKNVIAVGAVDRNNRRWCSSQYASGSNYGCGLSLTGPGESWAAVASSSRKDNTIHYCFETFKGTSSAVPNVSGVASLVWGLYPQLSAEHVFRILAETAHTSQKQSYNHKTGYGLVNAEAAVRRAIALQRHYSPTAS